MTSTIVSVACAVFAGMWASVLDASVFAALVVVAIKFAKPNASTRHLVNWLVLVLALAVPIASVTASLGRIQDINAKAPVPALSVAALRDLTMAARPAHEPATPEIDLTIPRSQLVGTGLVIWLSVALFKAFALGIELLALRRVKRRAKPLDRAMLATLRVWNATAGTMRKASIAISRDVDVPCAAGLWAPAILLPERVVAEQSADDIDRIVMHESAHLARYDDWTNVLERALGAVLWFNPALAFARRRIAVDREIACDDWVVARMGGAHGYASCLLRLAEATRSARPASHALGAIGNARHITQRIEHLLSSPKSHGRRVARTLLATLGVAAIALTIVQGTQAPAIAIDRVPEVPAPAIAPIAPEVTPASPRTPVTPHVAPISPIASISRVARVTAVPPVPPVPAVDDANLRAQQARLNEAAAALSKAARAFAAREVDRVRAGMAESSRSHRYEKYDTLTQHFADLGLAAAGLSASQRQADREAIRDAERAKAEAQRDSAQAEREASRGQAEAARARADGMREAMRARMEALRASTEAVRESMKSRHFVQAEIQRETSRPNVP